MNKPQAAASPNVVEAGCLGFCIYKQDQGLIR